MKCDNYVAMAALIVGLAVAPPQTVVASSYNAIECSGCSYEGRGSVGHHHFVNDSKLQVQWFDEWGHIAYATLDSSGIADFSSDVDCDPNRCWVTWSINFNGPQAIFGLMQSLMGPNGQLVPADTIFTGRVTATDIGGGTWGDCGCNESSNSWNVTFDGKSADGLNLRMVSSMGFSDHLEWGIGTLDISFPTPEPSSIALFASALSMAGLLCRRAKR